jgi:ELWxxDGT repeat protein
MQDKRRSWQGILLILVCIPMAGAVAEEISLAFSSSVGDGLAAVEAPIGSPADIAVDSTGAVFLADPLHTRVRKFSPSGSIGAMPRFKDANWNYLTEGSPGWDQGQRPSLIPQLAGIPIERAETRDHDGNVRPLGAGYEIGAFEGSGGCVAVPGARGVQHLAVLPLLVGILRRARTRLRLVRQGSRPATVRRRCASAVFGALIGPVALCVTARGQEVRGQEARDPLAEELCFVSCFDGDDFIVRLRRGLVLFSAREGLGCFEDDSNCAPPGIGPDICDGLDYRGCELWGATGPGLRGAHLVKDINPGERSGLGGCPQPIVIDDVMYFVARDGVHGKELWRSDGTTEGTWMVKDVSPGSASGVPGVCATNGDGDPSWVALGNVLIFVGFTPEHGYELWRSDGTEQGTWLLRDIWPGPRNGIECGEAAPVVPGFAVLGDKVLFKANDGVTGLEPWVTDGTPEGTRLLKDTVPGSIRVEGVEFLLGAFGDRRRELRRPDDDGCEGIVNGPVFTVRDGLAFFSVEERDTTTGRRVSRTWRTDGTPRGTYRADELRGSSDGGCAIAPGATGAASMFVGFAFLFALRRDHRW